MANEGNQSYVGGILNLTGTRPGNAFRYEGISFPDITMYLVNFKSTYEAIEKLILPPPLKADRSLPPEIQAWYFTTRNCKAIDGRPTPYQGFQFRARTEYSGVKGAAGWEYIDGLYGDKTHCDLMGPWGVYFGMAKKFADIRFIPIGVDHFEVSVTRRGVRLITMEFNLGAENSRDQVQQLAKSGRAGEYETLTVREVPDVNYAGFVDRTVCASPTHKSNKIERAWAMNNTAISFGHLELDPLDELPVIEITSSVALMTTADQTTFTEMRVIGQLPREVHRGETESAFAAE